MYLGNLAFLTQRSLDDECCCFKGEVYLLIIINLPTKMNTGLNQGEKNPPSYN